MRFRLGLRARLAAPGDVVEVAPGVAHSVSNPGGEEARVRVEVRPALTMERMLAEVVEMAHAGRLTPRGLLREFARLARAYDDVAHSPVIGLRLQRLLVAPLATMRSGPSGGPLTQQPI
jgi:hypothetical protein